MAHFKLACIGNLAFKEDQSRNVIWQSSHGIHLNINKHNDAVIGWVQNTERENNTTMRVLLIYLMKIDNVRVYRHVRDYPNLPYLFFFHAFDFSKILSENTFRAQVSKPFGSRPGPSVSPDLGPNCLQRSSAGNKTRR